MTWEEETKTLSVDGDWIISVIGKQHETLSEFRTNVLQGRRQSGGNSDHRVELAMDVRRIGAIDASGCQLLTAFLKVVEKDGYEPRMIEVPESLREVFESLGYLSCIRPVID